MMNLLAGVMVAALATASAETPLSELGDLLVGQWTGQASLIDHVPESGDAREKVAAELTYCWVTEGKVLKGEWKRGPVSASWLLMWDPAAQVIKATGGRSDGNAWQGVIIKKGNEWIEETEGVLDDGSKVTSRFVTLFQNDNTQIIWEGEFSIDGEKQESIRDVYHKVGDAHPLQALGGKLVGRWIGDVTLIRDWPGIGKRGEKIVAYWTVRWTADRKALLCEWQGGQGVYTSLWAWDPVARRILDLTARSDGITGLATITQAGDKWISKAEGGLADGTKASHDIAIEFHEDGRVLRMRGEVIIGGEKTDPLDDVYRRLD
jgi:hypothetical protein